MVSFKEVYFSDIQPDIQNFLLVGDIGGTNSNFGLFQWADNTWNIVHSFHVKTKQIDNFTRTVQDLYTYIQQAFHITIQHACFAGAGPVYPDRTQCTLTNAPITINAQELQKALGISCVLITNDFEVIGYGINCIATEKLIQVKEGEKYAQANKVYIGAGTGLGASVMHWDYGKNRYNAVTSEGGHADFSVQDEIELALVEFIRKTENRSCNVSWEDILSGAGIKRMYQFFKSRNHAVKSHRLLGSNGPEPDEIFNSKDMDDHARYTYELYAKLYGRFAKSSALASLSLGGLYIAGGIAAHNVPMFQSETFLQEFLNCGKQQALLERISITIVADYNVSLYGAAEYMRLEDHCS
ncbi:MAG TPA: ROK family protein [Candidatus Dependentiae bacterium]|nr:ROK family protein [Candidatus Dependentiae bacterium]